MKYQRSPPIVALILVSMEVVQIACFAIYTWQLVSNFIEYIKMGGGVGFNDILT